VAYAAINPEKIASSAFAFAGSLIRFGFTTLCFGTILFWHGAMPPNLDPASIQTSSGIYECRRQSNSGKNNASNLKIAGVLYWVGYENISGGYGASNCYAHLQNLQVNAYWIPIENSERRLLIELVDTQTGLVVGKTRDENLQTIQKRVSDHQGVFKVKIFLAVLGCILLIWPWLLRVKRKIFL
jgi:hypothetical protein